MLFPAAKVSATRGIAVALVLMIATPSTAHLTPAAIDAAVKKAMRESGAKGLAIVVINEGRVVYIQSHVARNARAEPLQPTTNVGRVADQGGVRIHRHAAGR